MKRGGKEQHSKIGPVNNGEDVAGNAVVCWRGDETDTFACCHGKLRVRKSSVEVAASCRQKGSDDEERNIDYEKKSQDS